jgi:hypothetical protein
MSVTYRPGPIPLVAVPGLTLLTPDEGVARQVWDRLATGAGPDDLLRDLIRDGFAAIPTFVLVDVTEPVARVLVRGDLHAEVDTGRATVRWDGTGVSTWAERTFDRVTLVRIEPDAMSGDPLPLRAGVVRCGGFDYRPESIEDASAPDSGPDSVPEPEPAPAPAVEPEPAPVVPVPVPVIEPVPLIASVPVIQAAPAVDSAVVSTAPDLAQTRTDDPDAGFDHLFESTIMRSVEDAAIREVVEDEPDTGAPEDSPVGPAPTGADEPLRKLGDHDGYTVTAGDLDALREQTPNTDPLTPPVPSAALVGARLELSTGDLITLDRDVVIGRRPQVDRVQDGPVPTVVTVPSPQQDVSRTHLRIALSQDQVLATDLHSMNGTVLIGVDGVTRALDGGAPHTLADGDTLDLGDGITVTLRLNR